MFHKHKKGAKTRLVVHFDCGYQNALYVRGEGGDLSWDQGIQLKCVSPNEWVWETSGHFDHCTFKVLLNDRHYESGENHELKSGSDFDLTPRF